MHNWIFGVVAVLVWVFAIRLWWRSSNRNHAKGSFEADSKAIYEELERLRKAGDQEALGAWLKALSWKWRSVAWPQIWYGEHLQGQGRLAEGIEVLRRSVVRARSLDDEHEREANLQTLILTRMLRDAKRYDEATRVAAKGIEGEHAIPALGVMYAELALDQQDDAEAMRRFAAAVDRFPDAAEPAERYVNELIKRGQTAEAEVELKGLIRRQQRAETLAVIYARLATDRGDWPEAATRWDDVRDNFVFCAEAYLQGAKVLRKLGRDADAEAVLAAQPKPIADLI